MIEKELTEILYGGTDTALLRLYAGVCRKCGERFYTPDIVRQFEKIKTKLERQDTAEFKPFGKSFQVVL